MAKILNKLFFLAIAMMSILSFSFSQNIQNNNISCENIVFDIIGSDAVLTGKDYNYAIGVSIKDEGVLTGIQEGQSIFAPQSIISSSNINYELRQGNRILARSSDEDFVFAFPNIGSYLLSASVNYGSCSYQIQKEINSYKKIFVYIGEYIEDFNFGIIQNIRSNDMLLYTIIVNNELLSDRSRFSQHIRRQISYIRGAEDIYFYLGNYALIFDLIEMLQDDSSVQMNSKNVFIVNNQNKSLARKFLARFALDFDEIPLYIVSSDELLNILLNLSIGRFLHNQELLDDSLINIGGGQYFYSVGYVVDYLLFNGFPVDILIMILASVLVVVFIVFCKQVLGLSSFGVYQPLLFAISIHVVGLNMSVFLLFIAVLSKIIVASISNRFTLLVSAKLGLQIVTYISLTIIGMLFAQYLGFIQSNMSIFNNPMMLMAYFTIILISSKVGISSISSFGMKNVVSIAWFLVLSIMGYFILSSRVSENIVLLYPSIIILSIFVIIVLGRYTGLQVIEYVRFWPLIKHLKEQR